VPYTKTIVCLANSRKWQGRCVAGLQIVDHKLGEWVRPVAVLNKGELHYECICGNANGRDPKLLDVLLIEFLSPHPTGCQTENHRIDPGSRWIFRGTLWPAHLRRAVEQVKGPLWVNHGSSAFGMNDTIPAELAVTLPSSLKLIRPEELVIRVRVETSKTGEVRYRTRGEFCLSGYHYVLSITDPAIEKRFQNREPNYQEMLESPILCVSIAEPLQEKQACYKLIAGIIETS
jgi:hypothetical protein